MPGLDRNPAPGHLPAVLRPSHHARLYCCHEPGLWLEQEGGWYRAQQLLLGLLPDSGGGRPPWGSHRRREGHLAVSLRLGLHYCHHTTACAPRQRPPGLPDILSNPHRSAPRTLVTGGVGSVLLDQCGWQSVFYFSGGLTLLWAYYVYRYLLNEKDLVLALGFLAQGLPVTKPSKVPWRQLFRKASVWAAICSQLCSACSFFILLSWLPTFFKETFPNSKGWVFNVVPWMLAIPASLFSGFISDRLISQGYRVITVRKFMQVMGLGLSSIFALCLGHTTSFLKAMIFASASIGFQTFNHSGISVNIQDLAPSCAGFLFGVANTAGALAGVVGVCLSGYLIETTGSWTCVFHLVAIISNLGLGTFLVFGKAQRVDLVPTHEDL
ncbi:voltage-gated purine nucleotide uniporter SLC17A9 isoform X2 [Mus musculus]|uniref:voltage-gated purine nucleotide uniporter SLC17A9 isoform X2 n=1 Tax=Mus musculus TaxID=10090 RepID=UPI0003D75202|nr:solute carrier family 17 member 9 isoform X2 [Mus musculus]|eukprot:XP_006500654.1 PREDICTED: solute carrier family 17 member 9 isoform X2 [Mus musculus]